MLIAEVGAGEPRRITTPGDIRIMAFALSPDATELAVLVKSANEAWYAVTPLTRWEPRKLLRVSGPTINSRLWWRTDGYLYFADWDVARHRPVLRRLRAAEAESAPAETYMTLPERCSVLTVTLATRAPIGVCNVDDFRGDVYLWRLSGVTQ